MKLYRIQVIGPNPARYRGLLAADDQAAIFKAQQRHRAAGFPIEGHEFRVTDSLVVVCGSVAESAPDTPHTLSLTDGQLAEFEIALLDRIGFLEAKVDVLQYGKPTPALSAYRTHLRYAREALVLVAKA